MSTLSLDKFLELLERSKLVEYDELSRAVNDWKSQASIEDLDDAQPCASHLVETGLLTHWQCRKLQEGRHRGFYLGKYKLLDHLGSGGMSSVYLAEHLLMQRRVAVKVLPYNRVSDASYLARFHYEAQAAAALDHRNIVRAFDLDNEGKIHYLVMEYIEGHDLHALVCQDGPLDFHLAADCVAQAATGLEHAHGCGLVHRDIKPANLLMDLKGTVKILDMGLAKFTAASRPARSLLQDEHVLGTADYLAPEQAINSHNVDQRADIYSLGCTLYFLLTGHPPFAEGTSLERMHAHQQRLPPSVLLDRPDAPAALVTICKKMMEKSVHERYQTATEVHEALSEWLQSEAALGRVGSTAAVAAKIASGPKSRRELPKSKANLVEGSALDLHGTPGELPRLSSPWIDTDSNLHRATVKLPSHVLESKIDLLRAGLPDASPPQDSRLALPTPSGAASSAPAPPPIVCPPSSPPVVSRSLPADYPVVIEAPPLGALSPDAEPLVGPALNWGHRGRRLSASSTWWWILYVCGTLLLGFLLAAFAFSQ